VLVLKLKIYLLEVNGLRWDRNVPCRARLNNTANKWGPKN